MATTIFITFIVGCIIAALFRRRKREIEKSNAKRGARYFFYKNSLDFLVPFICVAFLYLALSIIISSIVTSNDAVLQTLIQFEESTSKIKSVFSIFKLNAVEVLIALLALYLLGFLRFFAGKTKSLFRFVDKYQTIVRQIYIFLVLLCSFTFFGTQIGEPTQDLKLRIKTIRDGYADICKEVQEAVSEEVALELYTKVQDSFPQSYKDAIELPRKIEHESNSLHNFYDSFQSRYDVRDLSVERIIEKHSLRIKIATDLKTEIQLPNERSRLYYYDPDPRQTSYRTVNNAKTAIREYRSNLRSRIITLLEIEGGKKITCQVPKVFIGKIKETLFRHLLKEYPILEPIVDVFFRTLDKEIETRVERATDRITKSTLRNPETLGESIRTETLKIAEQKLVQIFPSELTKVNQSKAKFDEELFTIESARRRLDFQIEQFRINELISQLRSDGEGGRSEAVKELIQMKNRLSREQIDRLIDIMRNGSEKWEIQIRERWEGRTCYKTYRMKSVREYASEILEKVYSPHLNPSVRNEAKDFCRFTKVRQEALSYTRVYT